MKTPNRTQPLPPSILTIFGMSGNLAQTKLLPAIYHLLAKDLLPQDFSVLGVFRSSSKSLDHVLQQVEINLLRRHIDVDERALRKLRSIIHPIIMDSTNQADYTLLSQAIAAIDNQNDTPHNRLFYLAIPPDIFHNVIDCLRRAGLSQETTSYASRILVEKPFGTDYDSAKQLIKTMKQHVHERQIYRIDHYLAKENAQNILTFRFSNPLFEGMWGKHAIDHIQITAAESIGIDDRGSFYENMGALRDFVQSHLMQMMCLVTMERPQSLHSKQIHEQKLALLNCVQPIAADRVDTQTARGQYKTYRHDAHSPKSNIETFAAVALEIDNPRWRGVPILLRTGKNLRAQKTDIKIVFRDRTDRDIPPNILTIRIQPQEGIAIHLAAKKPGFSDELQHVAMRFSYQDSFEQDAPDAYERVLMDAIAGDQSLFASSDEVLRSWQILDAVVHAWQNSPDQPETYAAKTDGPLSAQALAKRYGCEWFADTADIVEPTVTIE
ncbi:glucose-6-phosphate dehydrogenase [Candidatus Saccharibacteria bacterium]|nr:MAG: glucose-6-phosphate dehydrogenase [Candidatus Saccharibacteria bacterium]